MLLSNRWRGRRDHLWRRRVFLDPLLPGQLSGGLDHIAMPLLSLNLGSGFSVDSVCHLRDRPGFAIQRTFDELFSNAPHFADALRIVLVNRLCEHNSQLISKLLFARQPAEWVAGLSFFPRHCFAILSSSECPNFRSEPQNYVLHSRTNQETQASAAGSGEAMRHFGCIGRPKQARLACRSTRPFSFAGLGGRSVRLRSDRVIFRSMCALAFFDPCVRWRNRARPNHLRAGAIGGRPRRLPSLLARASPARTRSAIIARSNSAKTPII